MIRFGRGRSEAIATKTLSKLRWAVQFQQRCAETLKGEAKKLERKEAYLARAQCQRALSSSESESLSLS